jgi:hypothetical protein
MSGWDPELNAQCTIPVLWEAWYEDRSMGVRGYLVPRSVNAFVGPSPSVETGIYQEGMSRRLVIFPPFDAAGAPITSVSARDRLTLSGPMDEPLVSPIKHADPVFDETGSLHHFEIHA